MAAPRAAQDPEKRKIYDEYGEDAIKEGMADRGGGGGGGMADIFDMFGGGGGRSRERKADDVQHRLKCVPTLPWRCSAVPALPT